MELYYAEVEAARREAEDAYFGARPQADTIINRRLFQAGFDRAYEHMYRKQRSAERTTSHG